MMCGQVLGKIWGFCKNLAHEIFTAPGSVRSSKRKHVTKYVAYVVSVQVEHQMGMAFSTLRSREHLHHCIRQPFTYICGYSQWMHLSYRSPELPHKPDPVFLYLCIEQPECHWEHLLVTIQC